MSHHAQDSQIAGSPQRWKLLAVLYAAMLTFALSFQSIPPILGQLMTDLGLSHGQGGALMGAFALPGILVSIPAGILADFYGPRKVGLISLALSVVGALLAASGSSFLLLAGARIIAGIGGMTIAVVVPLAASHWFANKELGIAMGVINIGMPLGTILSFNIFGRLGDLWGWRIPLLLTAIMGSVAFISLFAVYPHTTGKSEDSALNAKAILSSARNIGLSVWLAAAVWTAYNTAVLPYLTFAPDYYVSIGIGPDYANFLASLFMIGALLSLLVGVLIDKVKNIETLLISGNALTALILLFIYYTPWNPLALGLLVGMTASLVPAPVFALVPKLISPERVGLAFGIVNSCMNIGAAIGPILIGWSYDQTASFTGSFWLMAGFLLAAAIFSGAILVRRKR